MSERTLHSSSFISFPYFPFISGMFMILMRSWKHLILAQFQWTMPLPLYQCHCHCHCGRKLFGLHPRTHWPAADALWGPLDLGAAESCRNMQKYEESTFWRFWRKGSTVQPFNRSASGKGCLARSSRSPITPQTLMCKCWSSKGWRLGRMFCVSPVELETVLELAKLEQFWGDGFWGSMAL